MSDFTPQSLKFEEELLNMTMFDDDFFSTFQLPEMSDCGLENIGKISLKQVLENSLIILTQCWLR